MPAVEITIPVLNEEATLGVNVERVVDHCREVLADLGPICVVIADNGSTDSTVVIARSLEARHPGRVRLVRVGQRGVGGALKASWSRSRADIVGYMDLDLATDLGHLRPALTAIRGGGYDLVTGSRLARGAQVIGRSAKRAIISRVFNRFIGFYFRASFSDGMCGFKFLRRSVVPGLIEAGAVSRGWFFATELLVVAEHLNLRLLDLPVKWTDDPNSKVRVASLTLEYLKAARVLKSRLRGPA